MSELKRNRHKQVYTGCESATVQRYVPTRATQVPSPTLQVPLVGSCNDMTVWADLFDPYVVTFEDTV